MAGIEQEISNNRKRTNGEVEKVRANTKLSDEGKVEALAQTWGRGVERHEALIERLTQQTEKKREGLHSELYAPSFTIAEPDYERARIRGDYRRNLQEADKILFPDGAEEYNVDGLLRYLETAELAGDRHAAKAAFAIASNRNIKPVIERYLANRPEVAEKYEEHQRLERATREPTPIEKIAQSFTLAPPVRPPELRDRQPGGAGGSEMAQIFGGARR